MSRTNYELGIELIYAVLKVLSENGGSHAGRDSIGLAGKIVKPTGEECSVYDARGTVRRKAILQLQQLKGQAICSICFRQFARAGNLPILPWIATMVRPAAAWAE